MRSIITFIFLFSPLLSWSSPSPAPLVVIDPGHGGKDYGATYGRGKYLLREKNLTLALALEVSRQLQKKKIRSILTRRTDKLVPLDERTALANRLGAQIFISLHINSGKITGKKGGGVETFILNNSTNAPAKRLAELENSVLKGSIAKTKDQTDVSLIVKDLILDANLKESKHLACLVQDKLVFASAKKNKKNHRGVKQALFYILLGADMPSVLVETGFINKKQDRLQMRSHTGKLKQAIAIATAIEKYLAQRGSRKAQRVLNTCKVN